MTGRTRVKICGLTRLADAERAVALGADAVGFVFWPKSPRVVSVDLARGISQALPAFVTRVGVFVNLPPRDIRAIVDAVGLDAVQLHGDERVEDYRDVGARVMRAVGLGSDAALAAARVLPADVTPMVDAHDDARRGGTGKLADWARAGAIARERAIVLAGGLTAENVMQAVRRVRPWGVDVSSGVESVPGIKDAERLAAFFDAVGGSTTGDTE